MNALVCIICGGKGWVVDFQTHSDPYGEQIQCPRCSGAGSEKRNSYITGWFLGRLIGAGFDAHPVQDDRGVYTDDIDITIKRFPNAPLFDATLRVHVEGVIE